MSPRRSRALLALLLLAPVPSVGAALAVFIAPGPVGSTAWGAAKVVLYLFPALWHRLVERRPFRVSRPATRGLAAGAVTGAVLGAAILAGFWLGARGKVDPGPLRDLAAANGFDSAGRYLLLAAWLSVANSLAEEYAFRWFLLSRCRELVSAGPAVLLASAIFTAHHVVLLSSYFSPGIVVLGSAGVFFAGAIWSVLFLRYGSVWPGWVSHVVADVAVLAVGWQLLFVA